MASCHSIVKNVTLEYDFTKFTEHLPKGRFGNGIDGKKAEEQGLIRPVDFLEGISIRRQSLTVQKVFALGSKLEGMPDIIFSHKKHTGLNGCELCHQGMFVGVKKRLTK